MADPVTLTLIGTAVSAGTSIFRGIAGANANKYQAQVAEMNQKIALDNAERAKHRAALTAQDQSAETTALLGLQAAGMGASGLAIGSPSFVLARKTARELGRRDSLNIEHQGELEAYALRTEAANYKAEASASKVAAKNSLIGGFLGAGSSLISGASKFKTAQRYGRLPGSIAR